MPAEEGAHADAGPDSKPRKLSKTSSGSGRSDELNETWGSQQAGQEDEGVASTDGGDRSRGRWGDQDSDQANEDWDEWVCQRDYGNEEGPQSCFAEEQYEQAQDADKSAGDGDGNGDGDEDEHNQQSAGQRARRMGDLGPGEPVWCRSSYVEEPSGFTIKVGDLEPHWTVQQARDDGSVGSDIPKGWGRAGVEQRKSRGRAPPPAMYTNRRTNTHTNKTNNNSSGACNAIVQIGYLPGWIGCASGFALSSLPACPLSVLLSRDGGGICRYHTNRRSKTQKQTKHKHLRTLASIWPS